MNDSATQKNNNWNELAQRAQEGDTQSYKELLEALYPYVKAIIKRRLSQLVHIEDVTQNCLMGVHTSLATYDPQRSFKAWLGAIMRYKMADYFAQLSKESWLSFIEGRDDVTNSMDSQNNIESAKSEVSQLIESLPEGLKRALVLTKINGLSYEEAAQKEGISEAALRKRISRAYKALGQVLA